MVADDFTTSVLQQTPRLTQKDIIPSAIKNRNLGSKFAQLSSVGTAQGVLNNGDQVYFTSTLSSTINDDIIGAECYTALYVGSVSAANQLPGGSGIDESQWQVIGPFFDYGAYNNSLTIAKQSLYVRNISAGASQTVIYKTEWKYLSRGGS